METTVRTIYSAHLATVKALNKPFTIIPGSTMNEHFGVNNPAFSVANGEYPAMSLVAIGNRGVEYDLTVPGIIGTQPIPHKSRDAGLFGYMSFVLVEEGDDLVEPERSKYRMRVPTEIIVDGVPKQYIAYYLKVLDLSTVTPKVEKRTVSGNVISSEDFVTAPGDRNPPIPVISNVEINNPDGEYLVSTAKINFTLSDEEIQNLISVANILYGNPKFAVINEIAICSGIDRSFTTPHNGGSVTYTESFATQISVFLSQYYALANATAEINIVLDVGSVEPLLL